MKRSNVPVAALAFACLLGCDVGESRDARAERASAGYQAAMSDYRAGRLEAAAKGFEKAVRDDPANASARFQYATLLQDSRRDYVAAFCAYREFLFLFPEGDKAKLARDRAQACERELAKSLSSKYGLNSSERMADEVQNLDRELKASRAREAKLDRDLAETMRRLALLREENRRLLSAMKGEDAQTHAAVSAGIRDAKALLDDDGEGSAAERARLVAESRTLRADDGGDAEDRVKLSADIAALRAEGEAEATEVAQDLPAQAPDAKERRAAAEKAARAAKAAEAAAKSREPPHERRPETYVVEDGDTLTRIAIRFYGRPQAWKLIREANKAIISTDGRVKTGQTLVLPEPRR